MTNRERIINTALGEPVDRLPIFFQLGPWGEAIERWQAEGMVGDWTEAFHVDRGIREVRVNLGFDPWFEFAVLEEREHTRVIRDHHGITQEIRKQGASIPHYIDYPVKTREDWEQLKRRLDPDTPTRFPDNWKALAEEYNAGDACMMLGGYPYGLFGTLRDLFGVEELLVSFYDRPELIREIMDYLTDFWIAIYEKVCRDVRVDILHIWEDMSGRSGSLISMAMVREFMVPNYKKIRGFCDAHGIRVVSLDTDGNCDQLLYPFEEGGVNLVLPFEVQAGCDVVKLRAQHPELAFMGGFDKRALWLGKDAIDAEFDRLEPMFAPDSRFMLAPDHLIPPEVSLENMRYFMQRLHDRVGTGVRL